jgi:hypothetical protein
MATRLACESCGTNLDGKFDIPLLLQLPADDLTFITSFVRESGSLKAMAKLENVSYPTVRNRLDEIIARLGSLEESIHKRRHEILDALESGRITVAAAEEQLRKVGR